MYLSPSSFLDSRSESRRQLLDRVASVIEKARRKGSVVAAGTEAERLMTEYPNCPMTHPELQESIVRLARDARVPVRLA